ncbi:MAG TPA: hypothetical protein VFK02_24330, partial [Kofleriaceae bacterium]|nr:hypothetical protein [Kofleriaceae bacterium]
MRGPHDDEILANQVKDGSTERVVGGRPLLRLLHVLEQRGLEDTAVAAIEAAVPEEARERFYARAEAMTASPVRRLARRAARAAVATEAEPMIAQATLDVPPPGPPGPGPQWRSLGPTTIPNGQTYGSLRVNVSGRISAIAVDPHNPAHVLCGAANGGVWESFDRGGSWAPRTDYAATTTVGAITFHPTNSAIAYCGTGEGNWWSWLGVGILRSLDGGASWSTLCTAPFVGQGFYDLRIDPANASRLLAATTSGLYLSTDGGVTWTNRRAVRTWAIAWTTTEVLVASSDGIWRSTDAGVTFAAVALPGSPGSFDRIAVTIAPSNPGVAYAWGAMGTTAYLWRRASGTWTAASSLPTGVSTGQAWYDWYASASPDRDTEVYLGAIEAYRGNLSGSTWTWTVISNHATGAIHPDQHVVAFEPGNANVVYAGSDGGLYRSGDRGLTWVSCNNGLVISEFEYLAGNVGTTRWLIGGTQDNGTERWTGSPVWDHVADGDGGYVAVNHDDPRTVFHTYFGMSPERSATGGDFGSWTYIPPPVPSGEGSQFYPPMRCTDSNGATVAIGGGALYVSRNNGAAWTRVAFPTAATASAICVPNADDVYVAASDGRIFHTHWGGAAWGALTALTTPRPAHVSDVLVSASNLNRIWATYSTVGGGRVYRSDNAGSTWTDCSAGLPALPVNAIEIDSRNANRVWVAMDRGVWQSLSGGASWADFSNALPNAYVGDLCFHPHALVLRAGTRNRGVWEIPVDGWMTAPACGVQFTGSLSASQTATWFTFNWPATWHVIWTVMPTTPFATVAQVTWSVQVERASAEYVTYWIRVQNLTAVPVTFEGRYCILSR